MTYAEKLKDPRWQQRRLEIFQRDGWQCRCCGDKKTTLHVHHTKYTGEPWEAPDDDLTTLCEHCHFLLPFDEIDHSSSEVFKRFDTYGDIIYLLKDKTGVAVYVKRQEEDMLVRRIGFNIERLKWFFELTKDMI